MTLHKDQVRVREIIVPALIGRCLEESPEAARDATVMNRLFTQGADPLFLMEAAPDVFSNLCKSLGLDVAKGREAIEKAHWMGPATLLGDGCGVQNPHAHLSDQEACEVLWLYLAYFSDCVEDGYGEDITFLQRVQKAVSCVINLTAEMFSGDSIRRTALDALKKFKETANLIFDEQGRPHSDQDHAFYVAYKAGHPCCCVHTPTLDFWGTTDTTTLEKQGITVDKQISPCFGIVFHKTE